MIKCNLIIYIYIYYDTHAVLPETRSELDDAQSKRTPVSARQESAQRKTLGSRNEWTSVCLRETHPFSILIQACSVLNSVIWRMPVRFLPHDLSHVVSGLQSLVRYDRRRRR